MSDFLTPDTSLALMQAAQGNAGSAAEALKHKHKLSQIEGAARDFEAVFVSEMMKPMFEGLDMSEGPFGGGKGEEIFQGIMLQEYGKMVAQTGTVGIADHVKREMIKMQGLAEELNKIEPGEGENEDERFENTALETTKTTTQDTQE